MRARIAAPLLLLGSLMAGSCGTAPPVPVDYYYRLPEPRAETGEPLTQGVILVKLFLTDGVHNERALVFSRDADGLRLEQHHYHFWVDSPPRMVQAQLVSYLRAASAAPVVVADPSVPADLLVSGRIKRFERDISGRTPVVRVALEMRLDLSEGGVLVLVRDYSVETKVDGSGFPESAKAFSESLDRLFTEFLADARGELRAQ
jgi:ABC-type uncharacterized transport system auxiliary subunit